MKGYLYSCAVCDSLVGIDGLAEVLAVEEVLEKLLDLWNTGGSTHQHNLMHRGLVQL